MLGGLKDNQMNTMKDIGSAIVLVVAYIVDHWTAIGAGILILLQIIVTLVRLMRELRCTYKIEKKR